MVSNSLSHFLFSLTFACDGSVSKKSVHIFFHADYNNSIYRHERPRGGNCWFINKKISIIAFERFNKEVSKIRIKDDKNGFIDIYGVWFQFDDNSNEQLSEFQSNLSLIAGHMKSI